MLISKKAALALNASIKKWKLCAKGESMAHGTDDCPLCYHFYEDGTCVGCPIREFTGKLRCAGTPYTNYADYAEDLNDDQAGDATVMELASAELAFLKNIRKQSRVKAKEVK